MKSMEMQKWCSLIHKSKVNCFEGRKPISSNQVVLYLNIRLEDGTLSPILKMYPSQVFDYSGHLQIQTSGPLREQLELCMFVCKKKYSHKSNYLFKQIASYILTILIQTTMMMPNLRFSAPQHDSACGNSTIISKLIFLTSNLQSEHSYLHGFY